MYSQEVFPTESTRDDSAEYQIGPNESLSPRKGTIPPYSGRYYPRHFSVMGHDLVIAEAPLSGSTGREVWRVAEHLVCLFEKEFSSEMLSGKRIIELGCGCGLLGLSLAAISNGKAQVVLTDYDAAALEIAQLNVELNSFQGCVKVRKLAWGNKSSRLVRDRPVDFVVGSDIIYNPHSLPGLQETLRTLLSPGATALLAHEHRQPVLEQRFYADLQAGLGLVCERIKRRYLDRREDATTMSVYQVKAPRRARGAEAAPFRPISALPQMLHQSSCRPGTAAYRRPFSAHGSASDEPSLTQSSVSQVVSVSFKSINNSRGLLAGSRGREGS